MRILLCCFFLELGRERDLRETGKKTGWRYHYDLYLAVMMVRWSPNLQVLVWVVVAQLVVHKCGECGQPLPDSYKPPSNEPWTTGIFGCGEDMDSCELSFLLLHISFTYLIFYFVFLLKLTDIWVSYCLLKIHDRWRLQCPNIWFGTLIVSKYLSHNNLSKDKVNPNELLSWSRNPRIPSR
jgi:hypothetical protein